MVVAAALTPSGSRRGHVQRLRSFSAATAGHGSIAKSVCTTDQCPGAANNSMPIRRLTDCGSLPAALGAATGEQLCNIPGGRARTQAFSHSPYRALETFASKYSALSRLDPFD
jgi:hypothetical protein